MKRTAGDVTRERRGDEVRLGTHRINVSSLCYFSLPGRLVFPDGLILGVGWDGGRDWQDSQTAT